ncbi:MAG: hypothetical protein ACOYMN_13580 [Roseimicrobium sp.]
MNTLTLPTSGRFMVCCTLDTVKTPDGPQYYKRRHCGARYRSSNGQHYIVDHRGAL